MYRTQKARGIECGFGASSESGNSYKVAVALAVLPYADEAKIAAAIEGCKSRGRLVFARPCPVVPRHGFVESRPVSTVQEVLSTYQETIAQDPLGEVVLMEQLTGKYSAVMTSMGVTWGENNDGVTSGKGKQYVIPAPSGRFDDIFLPILGLDPKKTTESVYIELVEESGLMTIVQMRLGPRQPDNRVKRVLVAPQVSIKEVLQPDSEDLIDWDKKLRRWRGPARIGLAWLPGHSLSSHFVVQAIANGYNVSIEDTLPEMPDRMLQPDKNELVPLTDADYAKLAGYLKDDTSLRIWDFPRECMLSVGILHALPYWDNADHLLRLRSRGVIAAARFALAACLGEARHKRETIAEGEKEETPIQVPWKELMGEDIPLRSSRGFVFLRAFSLPWEKGADYAKAAAADHILPGYDSVIDLLAKGKKLSDLGVGYRGPKWEWASLKCHDLFVSVDKFIADPCRDNWNLILGFYNEIINAAHNGGYLFTKWISSGLINNVAVAPSIVFGFPQVMNVIFGSVGYMPKPIWLPTSVMTPSEKNSYMYIPGNVLVHKDVHRRLMDDGRLLAGNKLLCSCHECITKLWATAAEIACTLGHKNYVHADTLLKMPESLMHIGSPSSPAVVDMYPKWADGSTPFVSGGKSIEEEEEGKDEENNEEEEEEEPKECYNCFAPVDEEGNCSNKGCILSPAYEQPKKKKKSKEKENE